MERSQLGGSDLRVSRVGLGCNNFGGRVERAGARRIVAAALDVGINFFDTADIYGLGASERFLGKALGKRRSDVVIATKFGHETSDYPGGSREGVHLSIEASLARLGTDIVDLYYYHRPDGIIPLAETLGAMYELVQAGSVRWLGLSNVDEAQIAEAHATGVPVAAVQNRYSLMRRDDDADVLPLCRQLRIGYVPYFPLESGLLTGKYLRGVAAPEGSRLAGSPGSLTDDAFDRVEELEAFAESHGRTLLELAAGGLASIEGVSSVIAGATSEEQVRANAAAGSWRLPAEDLDALAAMARASQAI